MVTAPQLSTLDPTCWSSASEEAQAISARLQTWLAELAASTGNAAP